MGRHVVAMERKERALLDVSPVSPVSVQFVTYYIVDGNCLEDMRVLEVVPSCHCPRDFPLGGCVHQAEICVDVVALLSRSEILPVKC